MRVHDDCEHARLAWPTLSKDEVCKVITDFEERNSGLKHSHCIGCHSVSLMLKTKGRGLCDECHEHKKTHGDLRKFGTLPVWRDEQGEIQYHLPPELQDLRIAEKLLIARVSVFVPLVHLQKGQVGVRGHVCSFTQDVGEICTRLPRLPEDVNVVKIVRKFQGEDADIQSKAFMVRKQKVLSALHWLKRYNHLYSDIEIQPSNMDWIENGQEGSMPCQQIETKGSSIEVTQYSSIQTQIPKYSRKFCLGYPIPRKIWIVQSIFSALLQYHTKIFTKILSGLSDSSENLDCTIHIFRTFTLLMHF